jgi:dTDP-4-amino-4,6-dideoxygalactose transaminase
MSTLAIKGGTPVRTKPFTAWPVWDETDEKALLEVLRSGTWGITDNPNSPVRQFEREFSRAHHARFGQSVFNGTAALQTALLAIGIDYGDEIIVPPYTFLATASACLMVGAVPVWVDVDAGTYNLDPARIEEAITARTRAIIPVHIGGCPADLDRILEIARRHNLVVIEDACQAHGAAWNGRRVGAIANLGCFSFQSSKNLNAGEGGMVLTDNQDLADRCWSVHNCGRVREGAWYQHEVLGGNFRMTQWQAGILLAQIRNFEQQARVREENGLYLSERLAEIGGFEPQQRGSKVTQHGYHLFISRYDRTAFHDVPREAFLSALQAEGIPCSPGYKPLYSMNAIKDGIARLKGFIGDKDTGESQPAGGLHRHCPVTERACYEEGVWFFQTMMLGTKKDMDDIAEAILKVKHNIDEVQAVFNAADDRAA